MGSGEESKTELQRHASVSLFYFIIVFGNNSPYFMFLIFFYLIHNLWLNLFNSDVFIYLFLDFLF